MSVPSSASSAYRRHDELFTQSGISLIKKQKKEVLGTDRCRTLEVTGLSPGFIKKWGKNPIFKGTRGGLFGSKQRKTISFEFV